MSKWLFVVLMSGSWAFALLGTWTAFHTTIWIEIVVVIVAVLVFYRASSSRASLTKQTRTAAYGSALYLAGFVLFASGMALKTVLQLPPPIPIIVAGAGIWAIGLAWTCAVALWNGSWFVGAEKHRS